MTRKEVLTDLLAKVEAGALDWPRAEAYGHHATAGRHADVWSSYLGSLDAAEALHEAVLPGWTWNVARAQGYAWAMTYGHVGLHIERIETQAETPARAWLIAIIKALIAMEDT